MKNDQNYTYYIILKFNQILYIRIIFGCTFYISILFFIIQFYIINIF